MYSSNTKTEKTEPSLAWPFEPVCLSFHNINAVWSPLKLCSSIIADMAIGLSWQGFRTRQKRLSRIGWDCPGDKGQCKENRTVLENRWSITGDLDTANMDRLFSLLSVGNGYIPNKSNYSNWNMNEASRPVSTTLKVMVRNCTVGHISADISVRTVL